MGIFKQIREWFGTSNTPEQMPASVLLHELMDKARRAQYAEQYDEALAYLDQALEITEHEHSSRANVDISLSRADILIAQKDYETARFVLEELRDDSIIHHLNAPLAYSLCSLGMIEQAQGNLTLAQELYEEARDIAEKINTDGASGRATAHLGDVYLKQGNASYAAYLLEEAIIKLNRSGDHDLLGYFLGKLGLAQIASGQVEQGELRLQRGLDLATGLKHHAQMRYLNILLGEQTVSNNQFRQAKKYFEDALKLYSNPPPETTDYARLLCQLSKVSLHQGEHDRAENYAEQGLALAEKLDEDNLVAMAKAAIGLAMQARDDDNALSYLQAAVEAYETIEVDSFYIDTLRNLARAQIKTGDESGGIKSYEDAIEKASELPLEAAHTHSDLANLYAGKQEFRKAINHWQHAIRLYRDMNQKELIARARCDIAAMYDRIGDGRLAQREYGNALEMIGQLDDADTRGIILANVAAAYSEYGDVDSAQDFFKEAIEIAQRTRNPLAEALRGGNYGRLLALTNRPKQALTQLKQAQGKSEELDLPLQAAIITGNMGLAYANLNEPDAAIEQYQLARSQLAELDAPQWEAYVYANLADVTLSQNDIETAEAHYDKAFNLAQDNQMVDILIQTVIGKVQIAILQNDLETAERKLNNLVPIANRQNYRRLLALIQQTWSQLYAKQGKSDEAQKAWDEAKKLRSIMRMSPVAPDWL